MIVWIGFGQLAKSLLQLTNTTEEIYIFHRRPTEVRDYMEMDKRIRIAEEADLKRATKVFLLLPSSTYEPFFKSHGHSFQENVVFFHFATALLLKDVEKLVGKRKVIPCKCVGQAVQMAKDKKGLFLVPKQFVEERQWIMNWFGQGATVLAGEEELVLHVNKLATEAAIRMVVTLKNELIEHGIPNEIINQSISVTTRGVIEAFVEGKLGGFGRQMIKKLEEEHDHEIR